MDTHYTKLAWYAPCVYIHGAYQASLVCSSVCTYMEHIKLAWYAPCMYIHGAYQASLVCSSVCTHMDYIKLAWYAPVYVHTLEHIKLAWYAPVCVHTLYQAYSSMLHVCTHSIPSYLIHGAYQVAWYSVCTYMEHIK